MFDKRLMALCPESKKYIAGNVLLQFLELCCNAVMIAAVALSVQGLFTGSWSVRTLAVAGVSAGSVANLAAAGVSAGNLAKAAVIIAATIILRFLTTKYATRMSYLASRSVKQVLRGKIYEKLLRLGSTYREHASTAELVQESVEGVEQLESYFGQYVPQFFYAFLAPVMLFFLFGFSGSWRVAIVLLVCVPLIPAAIIVVQKIAKKILAKYWGQYTQLGSTFLENLQGMTALKIYQADEYKNQEMNRESEQFRKVTMAVLTMQLNSVTIMDFVAYGGAALGILLAVKDFLHGNIGLAAVIFMILLSADFFLPMRRLGSYFHVAMNGMAASDKIFQFLNEEEPRQKTGTISSGDIALSGIRFSYDGEREILHGVDITVPEHSFVGIVGESGSGKSTVASLLVGRHAASAGSVYMGRHAASAGSIKIGANSSAGTSGSSGNSSSNNSIGGKNINDISEEALMQTITYVGFNPVLFKGTVRENLLLADPTASDERLWEVLSECALAEFLKSEKGLDTELLENGANLSGGQRQRLALARAVLHDSPVYIFDEATSNIDVESEEAILSRIKTLKGAKTVILISHRLANVTEADRIYVMEEGNVVQSGTHQELVQQDGVYQTLWRTQSALEQYGKEAM